MHHGGAFWKCGAHSKGLEWALSTWGSTAGKPQARALPGYGKAGFVQVKLLFHLLIRGQVVWDLKCSLLWFFLRVPGVWLFSNITSKRPWYATELKLALVLPFVPTPYLHCGGSKGKMPSNSPADGQWGERLVPYPIQDGPVLVPFSGTF